MAWPTREELRRSLERHVRQPRNTSANTWWLDELTDAILARFDPWRADNEEAGLEIAGLNMLIVTLRAELEAARNKLDVAYLDGGAMEQKYQYVYDLLTLALPLARAALDAMEPNQKSWSALAGIARIVNDMTDAQRERLRGA